MNSTRTSEDEIRQILTAFNEINQFLISSEFNLDSVLHIIIKKALELSEGKYGQILFYNGQDLVIAATTGDVEKGTRLLPDECICGIVVEKRNPILLNDVEKEKRYHRFFRDAQSELAVPLMEKERVLGVINIESPDLNAFTEHHQDLLTTMALQASSIVKIARLYEQQKALAEIEKNLAGSSKDPEEIYELIIQKSLNLIGGRSSQLLLKENDELVIAATTGQEKPFTTRVHIDNCISGLAIKSKKPVNVGDVSADPYNKLYKSYLGTMKSELVIPLIEKDEAIGAINFENPVNNFFEDNDIKILLVMADHATVAIRNLEIYQKLQNSLLDVKKMLIELEDYPEKLKKTIYNFHKIVEFFEVKEGYYNPSLFPPTGDY